MYCERFHILSCAIFLQFQQLSLAKPVCTNLPALGLQLTFSASSCRTAEVAFCPVR